MNFIDHLHSVVSNRKNRALFIDHSRCKELDLCASLVMDTIIEQRRRSAALGLSGKFSDDDRVNILLRASGLLERINHPDSVLPPEIEAKVGKSDLFSGFSKYSEKSHNCDRAATGLTEYFSKCLERSGLICRMRASISWPRLSEKRSPMRRSMLGANGMQKRTLTCSAQKSRREARATSFWSISAKQRFLIHLLGAGLLRDIQTHADLRK